MIMRVLLTAAFMFAVVPGPDVTVAGVEPVPSPVVSGPLSLVGVPLAPTSEQQAGNREMRVEVLGRSLSLSVVRAGSSGLAVLSTPPRSVISSLPDITPTDFQELAARESGCIATGDVRVLGSERGTVALATGLSCS